MAGSFCWHSCMTVAIYMKMQNQRCTFTARAMAVTDAHSKLHVSMYKPWLRDRCAFKSALAMAVTDPSMTDAHSNVHSNMYEPWL